jgi:hypothetical protein
MRKKSVLVGAGAFVALSLFAASPAQAADTVTTSDVAPTAWTQVLNPYYGGEASDANYFADYDLTTEPLVFPFVTPDIVTPVGEGQGIGPGFDLAWIAPAPVASCGRVVNGFTISITNPTADAIVAGVALASSSNSLESTDPGTVVAPGVSTLPGVTSGAVLPLATQVFTATLEAPIAWSTDVSAILALQGNRAIPHSWTINSVTFNVTDTCADAVVPAVVAPAVEAVAPVAKPTLANTGADFTPMGLTAGALLLGGIAAVGAVTATRRIRNPRH